MRWCRTNPHSSAANSQWYMWPSTGDRSTIVTGYYISLSHTYRGRFLSIGNKVTSITKEQFHYYHQHPNEVYMECLL